MDQPSCDYGAAPRTAPSGAQRPNARPNWWGPATRAQSAGDPMVPLTAPVSQVEVMFHHQYTAAAPPLLMDDVRALLASEPTPGWVKPQRPRPRLVGRMAPPSRGSGRRPKRPAPRRKSPGKPIRPEPQAEVVTKDEAPKTQRFAETLTRPGLPPWLGVHEEHTEGGVQNDIALHVTEKIRQLQAQNSKDFIWVIIESCRDCAHHDSSLRHDETAYKSRCQKLTESILEKFPEGVHVDVLAEPLATSSEADGVDAEVEQTDADPAPKAPPGPNYRIGSLEVYMCCMSPLRPWGAAPLSKRGFGANIFGLCISSKLKSRAWPSNEAVLKRMSLSMPQVPVEVLVRNDLGFPIPGVALSVFCAEQQVAQNSTDQTGSVHLLVPLFAPVTLRAERVTPALHMERQEKILEIMAPDTQITFIAETCVQLWQLETEKELIVYCRDPRMDMEIAVQPIPDLVPFVGSLEYNSGETLRADADGFIRTLGDPLADAAWMMVWDVVFSLYFHVIMCHVTCVYMCLIKMF